MSKQFLIMMFCVLLIPSVFASSAKLKYYKGEVLLNNKQILNKVGTEIPNGSVVITKKNSIALIEISSDKATKIIKLDQLSSLKISELKDKEGKTTLDLNLGSAFIKYLKKSKSSTNLLEVRSRSVTMGVRGTEFFVVRPMDKKQANDVWMCVNEGVVEVKNTDGSNKQLVKKGEGIHIKEGKKITKPKAYPWTKNLNWNMNPKKGSLENKVELESAYRDLLDYDYD